MQSTCDARHASRTTACIAILAGILACGSGDRATATAQQVGDEPDPCSFLTYDDIADATGTRPLTTKLTPMGVAANCSWLVDEPYPDYPLVSIVVTPQPAESWEAFMESLVLGEMEEIVQSGERVDVGRFGLYDERMLIVVSDHGTMLMLIVSPPFRPTTGRAGVLELAAVALGRSGPG